MAELPSRGAAAPRPCARPGAPRPRAPGILGPRPSEPPSACRMMQELCCRNQLEELLCAAGINLASEGDGCPAPHGDNASLAAMFVKVSICAPDGRPRAPPSSAATVH